jgi:tRNA-modifying protein YgfZ
MLNFYRFRQDYLKFEGNDRLDLINRLSTNQVNTLQRYSGIKTVLTNDKGRFVDLITLYNFGDFIFTACSFNNAANVISHLDKYTIMDDFKVTNIAGTHETILFYGDDSGKFAKDVFDSDIKKMKNNDFVIFKSSDKDAIITRNDDRYGGFMLIYAIEDKEHWNHFLFAGRLTNTFKVTDEETFQIERISLGEPSFGNEITEQTNPLECGLNTYVSFTKGCYIGQEVIARLDAYDKISKHLICIEAESSFQQGDKIITENKECGFVSSSIKLSDGNFKGLGFIKTIFLDFNKKYQIKSNNSIIECIISALENK